MFSALCSSLYCISAYEYSSIRSVTCSTCSFSLKGEHAFFDSISPQQNPANHPWLFSSLTPCLLPSRLPGVLTISLFTKSAASADHSGGTSAFLMECCLERMASLISRRLLPEYGLYDSL